MRLKPPTRLSGRRKDSVRLRFCGLDGAAFLIAKGVPWSGSITSPSVPCAGTGVHPRYWRRVWILGGLDLRKCSLETRFDLACHRGKGLRGAPARAFWRRREPWPVLGMRPELSFSFLTIALSGGAGSGPAPRARPSDVGSPPGCGWRRRGGAVVGQNQHRPPFVAV